MKLFTLICTLLALTQIPTQAATYYVAPTGSDTNTGTLASPYATMQKAQDTVKPGDTVLLRGGTYHLTMAQIKRQRGIYSDVTVLDKSGLPGAPITYAAYPKEAPIFDFAAVKPATRVAAFYVSGSYLHLKGFEVIGVQVTQTGHTQSECFENHGSHNLYEQLSMHDGQAIGFYLLGGSDNVVLNCDAYQNWDSTSEGGRGGNTDGFGCHGRQGDARNVFRGDRAWFNSDDGYDCIHSAEPVTFDHCWAYANGYNSAFKSLGDGNGFKAGGWANRAAALLPHPVPRNTVRFCIAAHNKTAGFYANHQPGGSDWFNNSAYANTVNFDMLCRLADNITDVPGYGHVMKNNLGFQGHRETANIDLTKCTTISNSFNDIPVTAADFVSLNEKQLILPRKVNGDLPDITFLRLTAKSELRKRGVPLSSLLVIGAPDLGAFAVDPMNGILRR